MGGAAHRGQRRDHRRASSRRRYFAPDAVAGRARRLGLVDRCQPALRARRRPDAAGARQWSGRVALLHPIAGGSAGPVEVTQSAAHLPRAAAGALRARAAGAAARASRSPTREVRGDARRARRCRSSATADGWQVTPPAHRFDIAIEADLIEEVARIVGFEAIPETRCGRAAALPAPARGAPGRAACARGARRARLPGGDHATPSSIRRCRRSCSPARRGSRSSNPIASDLSVMRVSLWPGLLRAALENQRRQQDRIRLFEHGTRFAVDGGATREIDTLAGIALGARLPEQWGCRRTCAAGRFLRREGRCRGAARRAPATRRVVQLRGRRACRACTRARSARVLRRGRAGRLARGAASRRWCKTLDFTYAPVLFELDIEAALAVDSAALPGDFALPAGAPRSRGRRRRERVFK